MTQTLHDVHIVLENKVVFGNVHIENGYISLVEETSTPPIPEALYVLPGFIDTHIHGTQGYDVMDADSSRLLEMASHLVKEGTTAFLATTLTQSLPKLTKALISIDVAMQQAHTGATLLGAHLEGPFISPLSAGAQPKAHIINPSVSTFEALNKAGNQCIKMVTLAPELEGASDLMKHLKKQDIVISLGHSVANYDTTLNAINLGASSVTHCFNAMNPLHHREVGLLGACLLHDQLSAEVILDGHHVSQEAFALLYKMKSSRHIRFVTDAMRAKGLSDGVYMLGDQEVTVSSNKALLKDGTLAGSTLPMNEALAFAHKSVNASLVDLAYMASFNPATLLSIAHERGSIEKGKRADLVVLDYHLNVIMTLVKGQIVYRRDKHDHQSI